VFGILHGTPLPALQTLGIAITCKKGDAPFRPFDFPSANDRAWELPPTLAAQLSLVWVTMPGISEFPDQARFRALFSDVDKRGALLMVGEDMLVAAGKTVTLAAQS
jgi:hypothetical protein